MAIRLDIIVDDKGTATVKRVIGDVKKEIRDTEKESKVLGGSLESAFSKAQLAIGGFLLATAGITAAIKKTIDYADSMNDLAKATGISVETLSALDFAAKQSGTNILAVSSAMRILAQNMESAKQGNNEASETFAKLGVDVTKTGQTLENVFFEVLDSLKGRQDRVALSSQLLGRGALELGSLAQEGSAGVRALMEQAARLGVVISEDQAANADAMADAIGRLNTSFQGFLNSSILPILPSLTTFVDKLTTSIPKILAWGDALNAVNDIIKNLTKPTERAEAFLRFNEAVDRIKAVTTATQEHKDIVMQDTVVWADRVPVIKETNKAVTEFKNTLDEIAQKNNEAAAAGLESTLPGLQFDDETLEAFDFIREENEAIADTMEQTRQTAQSLTDNLSGAMASAMLNLGMRGTFIKGMMEQIGKAIYSEIITALSKAIAQALFFEAILSIIRGSGGGIPIPAGVGVEGGVASVRGSNPIPELAAAPVARLGSAPINVTINTNRVDDRFLRRELVPMLNDLIRTTPTELNATQLGRQ